MEILYPRCCGLDVHKRTVVACLLVPGPDDQAAKEIRTFGTMTADLLALSDWLAAAGCTHVAMEATGAFWKPIYNLLEDRFAVLVVNAAHIKAVPGRKTDVRDAEWIADLLRHGLLRASFIPERPQRELRELTRYRTTLIQERANEVNRLQKVLEGANIKLASVATDILGRSGRDMLVALVSGTSDAAALAQLARGRLREKIPQLEQALAGQFGPHHRFLIAQQLAHIDFLDASLERVSAEIAERLRPFEPALERLQTLPGVGRRTAEVLLAEIGADLSRFPSAGHLASWAGLCPGNDESAGKRRSGRTRKGSPWLRTALVEAAQAAARTKDTYLAAQYRRLAARRGAKRAAVAVAHTLLVMVYALLTKQQTYQELGGQYFAARDRQAVQRRLVHRLEALGY
ncbi:MAG TPA: IS110 family transposase, partial [Ktedonobacterales bacterium]|nr:IS110 family transposase [Ktedonobacterales bacterium]